MLEHRHFWLVRPLLPWSGTDTRCPCCGSAAVRVKALDRMDGYLVEERHHCMACGHLWSEELLARSPAAEGD